MSFIIRQTTATGKITDKKGNILIIELVKDDCGTGSIGCENGCSSCNEMNNIKEINIYSQNACNYRAGEIISFDYYDINDIFMTSFAFGVPVCCSIITVILWFMISPSRIESPLVVFTIVLSFAFGFVLIWLTDLIMRKKLPATIHTPPSKK